ncbi:xylulokinase [Gloeocapsopsis sp. IPPAS B-1203]|uniref:xylulokinase n=1 Tax=Gloeocapsopsis sp. IPPAS B-1203 TaxID=2049454 RepID=UPI000C19574E|nr:xylulokinase [Gloeocapsopsis sp. IPPAS B-1203]PIG92103.1 xylulokinase [Gloeocapsopsis sp. IPPAS B-1203]
MLLGIDLGTSSVKALLLDTDGTVVGEASSAYDVNAPYPGWAETDPEAWWKSVAIAVKNAVKNPKDIQAIALSGQMHGVVLIDSEGTPLRPAILWADTRSSEMLPKYDGLAADLRSKLANPIATGMAGASLLWLRQYEPETYAKARWVLQPKDWLRLRLTRKVAAEPSDASGTLLYDVVSDCWALDVIATLKLRSDWLPELLPSSSSLAGNLTPKAATHLGLIVNTSVIAGAADTAAAALGNDLVQPGTVQLTVGSAAQIITPRSQPIIDPHGRTHLYRAALPQQWYTLAAIQNAGLALEWVKGILDYSWEQVYAEAFVVSPGCEGLTFLPYLTGDRTPHLDPHARGAWVGLGLHHTRAHLMRAALEGVAFSLKQGLEAITATGVTVSQLRLAGGGTLEPVWQQLLADVLQVPLYTTTVAAASARGAAILAGMGIGVLQDAIATQTSGQNTTPNNPDSSLEAAWQRYQLLYPSLHQWHHLGD